MFYLIIFQCIFGDFGFLVDITPEEMSKFLYYQGQAKGRNTYILGETHIVFFILKSPQFSEMGFDGGLHKRSMVA